MTHLVRVLLLLSTCGLGLLGSTEERYKREVCGCKWSRAYTTLHRAVLEQRLPPRYALYRPPPVGGLADILAGALTAFWYAFLMDRALLLDLHGAPHLDEVYDAPHVAWATPLDSIDSLTTHIVNGHRRACVPPLEGTNEARYENVSAWGEGAQVVIFDRCYSGQIHALFRNPHHSAALLATGLRPETAFGCAHRYLFALKPRVKALFEEERRRLVSGQHTIGIHVRTYEDERMAAPALGAPTQEEALAAVASHSATIECARQIDDDLQTHAKVESQWLFLSDDIFLARSVRVLYGDKVFPDRKSDRLRPQHVRTSRGGPGTWEALAAAAGELWLYSLADIHVFGKGGFGRTGYSLSLRFAPHNVHLSGCSVTSYELLSTYKTGI